MLCLSLSNILGAMPALLLRLGRLVLKPASPRGSRCLRWHRSSADPHTATDLRPRHRVADVNSRHYRIDIASCRLDSAIFRDLEEAGEGCRDWLVLFGGTSERRGRGELIGMWIGWRGGNRFRLLVYRLVWSALLHHEPRGATYLRLPRRSAIPRRYPPRVRDIHLALGMAIPHPEAA